MINLLQVTGFDRQANRKTDWRNRTDVGSNKGPLGFHENPEEILACSDYRDTAVAGSVDCIIARFCGGALYLYTVLTTVVHCRKSELILVIS